MQRVERMNKDGKIYDVIVVNAYHSMIKEKKVFKSIILEYV